MRHARGLCDSRECCGVHALEAQDLGTVPSSARGTRSIPASVPAISLPFACPAPFGPMLGSPFFHRHRHQWPKDRFLRLTSLLQSVYIYQHPRHRPLFHSRGPTASRAYMTNSSFTYSHFSPTRISVRSTRPTATWHDYPSTTRYIAHSYQKFMLGSG